eukprot:TRINITY_DN22978_c0_g2_i2.p1 TRINITY_DN22978_c0_g2~~TRINITY_DN22978_c0_g2_i2.p1  ORF type:complete len:262 (+),score=73.01 TRINITY_DN22978_c0_g2_i2:34-819(+)
MSWCSYAGGSTAMESAFLRPAQELENLRKGLHNVAEAVRAMRPALEAEAAQRWREAEAGLRLVLEAELRSLRVQIAELSPLKGLAADVTQVLALQAKPRLAALERDVEACWRRTLELDELARGTAANVATASTVRSRADCSDDAASKREHGSLWRALEAEADERVACEQRMARELRSAEAALASQARAAAQSAEELAEQRFAQVEEFFAERQRVQHSAFEELVIDAALASGAALSRATEEERRRRRAGERKTEERLRRSVA